MGKQTIKIDQLDTEIQSIFSAFSHSVNTAVDKASETVSKKAIKKLRQASPTGHSKKHYKNSWKTKKKSDGTVVYNEQYQLTHLLENGHNIVINGEVRGYSPPVKHIAPVDEWVQQEFPEELKRQVEKGG